MTKPGPSVTSGADTQPGSDSLFPSGFGGGGANVRPGGVGTSEIADGSVAAADLNLPSVAAAIAARSELTGTYASIPASVARRVLANAAITGSDTAVSSLVPTITVGTAGAASTFSPAVRIAPKRLSSTVIDTANDPHFEYVGAIPGRTAVSSADMMRPQVLTGGSSQARRNNWLVRFQHTGQAFEFYVRYIASSIQYRLWVDGLPLSATMTAITGSSGNRFFVKVDFGSVAAREITLEIEDPEFGGVAIPVTDSITRCQSSPLLLAGFGDSHTAGANGVQWHDTWVRRAAQTLHCAYVNLAIGGSGYLNDNGTTGANYRNRLTTDIVPVAPDILVFEGSWNDGAATSAALQAEALFCFQTLKAALPNTLLIAAGPWVTSHTLSATLDGFDASLPVAAQAAGWHGYISYRDPLKLKASVAAWAATTTYQVGDMVTQNGFVQKCIVAHTSTGSFDQTKWRSTAIVGGTGKVGTTAADGNADVIVSNDGVHSTVIGHQVKSRHVAAEIARIARAIAAGSSWAG